MENIALIRKDIIISTAIDLIDEYGIQGLSTREIAKRQEVSEGTIFKHFKTKNGLILAVLDQLSKFDNEIILTIKIKKMKPLEAIVFIANAHMEYYENYPAITAITEAYDAIAYEPELSNRAKSIYANHLSNIKGLIEEAQLKGEIKAEADSGDLTDVIIGLFRSFIIKWRFNNKNFPLKKRTIKALKMVLNAFSK